MKIAAIIFTTIFLIICYAWISDIVEDRKHTVSITKAVPLYSDWENGLRQEPEGIINPGEKLKVLRIRIGKSFMAIKVLRENDSEAWIVYQNGVELRSKEQPSQ